MNKKIAAEALIVGNPFIELIYLERYHMANLDDNSREELYEAFSKRVQEIEYEMNFLKKQIRERDLRIQLYQFSDSKLAELKEHLREFPNLEEIWREFEIAYKIATGKNLIQFEELEKKHDKSHKKINNII